VPPALGIVVARAQSFVARAGEAASSRQARIRLRKAIRQLVKAGRVVRRQRSLEIDCIVAVATNLDQLRRRAERLAGKP
jgi:hypothetical protein